MRWFESKTFSFSFQTWFLCRHCQTHISYLLFGLYLFAILFWTWFYFVVILFDPFYVSDILFWFSISALPIVITNKWKESHRQCALLTRGWTLRHDMLSSCGKSYMRLRLITPNFRIWNNGGKMNYFQKETIWFRWNFSIMDLIRCILSIQNNYEIIFWW